jgi:porin
MSLRSIAAALPLALALAAPVRADVIDDDGGPGSGSARPAPTQVAASTPPDPPADEPADTGKRPLARRLSHAFGIGSIRQEDPDGILPLIDYSGDVWSRSTLTGDWGGTRSDLGERGIFFGMGLTTTLQSVVDGGAERRTNVGTSLNVGLQLDLMRMGLVPGGLLSIRAEGDFGKSIIADAGTITAVNYNALFPIGTLANDTMTLSDLYYTQFIGPKFGVFAGRFDTFHDGLIMEFAGSGNRTGERGFLNTNLTAPQMVAITTPYVTALGGGIVARPSEKFEFSAIVLDKAESALTNGLNTLGDEGWNGLVAALTQYRVAGLPGGAQVAASFVWGGEFTDLGGGALLGLRPSPELEEESKSWNLVGNVWQYVKVFEDVPEGNMELHDGVPDLRGLGLFLIWGVADQDTNPFKWSVAGGVGGKGLIPGRENDAFGIGYFYNELNQGGVVDATQNLRSFEQGFEIFYEAAVTGWFRLTPDIQVVRPGLGNNDTAVILGLRALVDF